MNRKNVCLLFVAGVACLLIAGAEGVVMKSTSNAAPKATTQESNAYAGVMKAFLEAGKSRETQKAWDDAATAMKNVVRTQVVQAVKKMKPEELEIMRGVVDLLNKEFGELYDSLVIMIKSDATPAQQKAASDKIADRTPGIQMKAMTTFMPFLLALGDSSLMIEVSKNQNIAENMLAAVKAMLNEFKEIVATPAK